MKPDDLSELWSERSAIKEYCGRMQRLDAEKQAWFEIKATFGLRECPVEIAVAMKQTAKEWEQANKVIQKDLF